MKIDISKQCNAEYELFPRVALINTATGFTLRGLGIETALESGKEYMLKILPREEIITAKTHCLGNYDLYETHRVKADANGRLHFSLTLSREQIYTVRLYADPENTDSKLTDLDIFCAEKDLFERTPMRGNTHAHACHSVDGHEDPAVAASVYRKAGFDYLAITDHHKVDGSFFAVEVYKNIPTEMCLLFGEEVHIPDAYIHAVNVGAVPDGGIGLDRYYHEHEEEVLPVIKKTAEDAKAFLPENIDPMDYAFRKWIADTVHANGGIAIIAHPFWVYDAHNTSNAMFEYLAKSGLFDAVEIVHGQEPGLFDVNTEIAFWNDLRAKGIFLPVVGCDDAHRRSFAWDYDSSFNHAYTLIFAKEPTMKGFAEAIKGGYSAAVESFEDAPLHIISDYRMTRFSVFLLEQYFPYHDELCFEEGCRMKDAYLGDEDSLEILRIINGRVKKYTDRFFGRI